MPHQDETVTPSMLIDATTPEGAAALEGLNRLTDADADAADIKRLREIDKRERERQEAEVKYQAELAERDRKHAAYYAALDDKLGLKVELDGVVFEAKVMPGVVRNAGPNREYVNRDGRKVVGSEVPELAYEVNGERVTPEDFCTLIAIARAKDQSFYLGALQDLVTDIKRDMRR